VIKLTRAKAQHIIYEIINSGIVSEEIEDGLNELANTLCFGEFEECEETSPYCENCRHLSGVAVCEE
jgi:hypothetical protein